MDYYERRKKNSGRQERRRKPDIVVKTVHWTSSILGISLLVILVLLRFAEPDRTFLGASSGTGLDPQILSIIMFLMVVVFLLSIMTIMLNKTRHRRKDDRYAITPFVTLFISVLSFIIYFFTVIVQ
ncbi:MAG: hypothetical protein MJB14_05000 [Spirochaetes bacterium]|nr:hypothetical protein [Spirochaetota bacterium]